jgi:protocatechuate 3,4-dioxygenase beta subunit
VEVAIMPRIVLSLLAAGCLVLPDPGTAKSPFYDPGPNAPSRIAIAGPDEPGTRLTVSGRVVLADGKTPAAGIVLYVYQTDHTGRYSPGQGEPPRLRGWMKTDGEGRYGYATVRPTPYPGGRIAAHIHTQLWGAGVAPQWNTELLFADDPRVPDEERARSAGAGDFAWVCSPQVRDGAARCVHNLRLKASGDRFEDGIRHGLQGPRPGANR